MIENSETESLINMDIDCLEETGGKKKVNKNNDVKKQVNRQSESPLLSPLRLNLTKSPEPVESHPCEANDDTVVMEVSIKSNDENDEEAIETNANDCKLNEDEILPLCNTSPNVGEENDDEDEPVVRKKKIVKKSKILESDNESIASSVSSKIKKSNEVFSNDDENSKASSNSEASEVNTRGRVTRSSAKNGVTKKEVEKPKNKKIKADSDIESVENNKKEDEIDSVDSDYEEVVNSAKKRKIKNKKSLDDDEDSEYEKNEIKKKAKEQEEKEKLESRRKIRKLIDDSKLKEETVKALEQENERLKRIEKEKERLNQSQLSLTQTTIEENEIEEIEVTFVEAASKKTSGLFLDAAKLLPVDRKIASKLKKHQIEGIQFMFENCYESVEQIKKGSRGNGCILAHCMGLGKTFQIVSFVHTLLAHLELTKTKRVIVLTPINALLNWRQEFLDWLKGCDNRVNLFEISTVKTIKERLRVLESWHRRGGVFIIGYTMFTNLVGGKSVKKKSVREDIEKYLINPGADLVVCDEGHILKNEKTATSKALNRVNSKRRIVLTGSPLQNNLNEYHCMTSFVKPSLLGTIKEFRNRFVNPINNGQHADSTEADVQYMKKRSHVLHKTLAGCVQRMDYTIIQPLIPPKHEFVISIRLSEVQQKLYKMYLEREGYSKVSRIGKIMGTKLFCDFNNLYRIWSHPWVLKMQLEQKQANDARKMNRDFIDDDDDEDDDENSVNDNLSEMLEDGSDDESSKQSSRLQKFDSKMRNEICIDDDDDDVIIEDDNSNSIKSIMSTKAKSVSKRKTRSQKANGVESSDKSSLGSAEDPDRFMPAWWDDVIDDDMEYNLSLSGKMEVFFEIVQRCEEINDKVLVFSHSLFSLDLIEKFLKHWTLSKQSRWLPLIDYFRIDGSTEGANRKKYINEFNDPESSVRLFLISSKAGGMGINLVGANRVIIFDASWNPVHDLQSIFRVYRFGQTKPVFIYRFLAQGTMEEKIYHRQVAKQSLALRVIDEHQLDRHFTSTELRELYAFDPDIVDPDKPKVIHNLPPDRLLADLLKTCDQWISKYHEHDSLLENRLDEGLSEQERLNAWQEFEQEKKGIDIRHQQMLQQMQQMQQQQAQNQNQLLQLQDLMPQMNGLTKPNLLYNMLNDPNDISNYIPNYQQQIRQQQIAEHLRQQELAEQIRQHQIAEHMRQRQLAEQVRQQNLLQLQRQQTRVRQIAPNNRVNSSSHNNRASHLGQLLQGKK